LVHLDAFTLLELDNKRSSLHSIDQDVTTLKQGIARPRADKVNRATTGLVVIFGIDIKETNFLDASTSRVIGDRAHVQNAETSTIVGLVGKAVCNVLVVVNALGAGLVKTCLLGCLE
jgi:hypothetical protein